jgi:oxazoline/thiazoline dehydrogenase
MYSPLSGIAIAFDRSVSILQDKAEQIMLADPQHKLTFKSVEPGLKKALFALANNGETLEKMSDWIQQDRGEFVVLKFYQYLQKFASFGWLCHVVATIEGRIAIARPMTTDARFMPTLVSADSPRETLRDRQYVLSRFAYIHQVKGQTILESPLSKMTVQLSNWQSIAIVGLLANSCTASTIATQIQEIHLDTIEQLICLLLSTQMLCEVAEDGTIAEQTDVILAQWEFHDLLFHARSRSGRHANPVGGTYRFSGQIEQLPALSPYRSEQTIALSKPDLANLVTTDLPFAQVLENRRSIREHGEVPITIQQLGEFLYRCARIKNQIQTEYGELLTRPYPSGGAMYELELYLAVDRCQDLRSGLYYYQPQVHELCSLCGATEPVQTLLKDAGMSMGADTPQLLIIITARFQRLAWKYESIAYALMLKHVGVLSQTMYLVATAMNLAPCAIGSGDSDLFTQAVGGNYYAQTSVGEFALGSLPEHLTPQIKPEL